jgi:hypothetical protein
VLLLTREKCVHAHVIAWLFRRLLGQQGPCYLQPPSVVLFGLRAEPLLSLVGRGSIALGVRAPGYVVFLFVF